MVESSSRLAWTQYRDGGDGTGSGLLSFNDRQPDKRQPMVANFFANITKYATIHDIMKGK